MRDVTFRAKRIDSYEWIYGNLEQGVNNSWKIKLDPFLDSCYDVHEKTIGQCLNFCDKDCNELYEGDIVTDTKNKSWKSEIVWTGFGFALDRPHPQEKSLSELICDTKRLKVLGNKFDNYDLLYGDFED